jgi:hypothetical protein
MKWRPVGIAILCLFAVAALRLQPSHASLATGNTSFTLPFDYIDNRVFVEVHLNGKGPYHFLLDTGADLALSDRVARELKLPIEDAGETSGVGEHRQRAGRARIPELTLGDLRLTGLDAYVLPDNDQSNVFGTKPLDGILGQPVFERLVVKHEYANHRLVFTDPTKFTYTGTGTVIPIDRPVQIPVIDAQLDGISGRYGVDTGARSSLLLYGPFCERNHLREKYNAHFEGVTGWGIGGPVRSLLARAHEFKIGNQTIHDPILRLSTQKSGLTTSSSMAGLIGPDILSQFDVTFDYSRHRMILEPNQNHGRPDSYDRAGVWMGQGDGTFTAIDVIPGGPADQAGLKTGDIILAIDGKSTRDLILPDVREKIRRTAPGQKITLLVESAGTRRTMTLTLRDLV